MTVPQHQPTTSTNLPAPLQGLDLTGPFTPDRRRELQQVILTTPLTEDQLIDVGRGVLVFNRAWRDRIGREQYLRLQQPGGETLCRMFVQRCSQAWGTPVETLSGWRRSYQRRHDLKGPSLRSRSASEAHDVRRMVTQSSTATPLSVVPDRLQGTTDSDEHAPIDTTATDAPPPTKSWPRRSTATNGAAAAPEAVDRDEAEEPEEPEEPDDEMAPKPRPTATQNANHGPAQRPATTAFPERDLRVGLNATGWAMFDETARRCNWTDNQLATRAVMAFLRL
jgi:hypothetical protein